MTKLDDAVKNAINDAGQQPHFYDLFLNTPFYVPVHDRDDDEASEEGSLPLLVEANDKTYLMLFDTHKRLTSWAHEKVGFRLVPGYLITDISTSDIYWALNYGCEQQKFFDPEEIRRLKAVVRQGRTGAVEGSQKDE